MSQCVVPNWNLSPQRQDQVEPEEPNRSSHVLSFPNNHHSVSTPFLPMSDYEIAELTWENGQLAMHGLSGPPPFPPTKPTSWCQPSDTLESIVRQATLQKQNPAPAHAGTAVAGGLSPPVIRKRARLESGHGGRNNICYNSSAQDLSTCASASATWVASMDSPRSFKTKVMEEDSAWLGGSENQEEDGGGKCETARSNSTRRSRVASVHNQSERKRRDKINQKMIALQKLIPNACKTDKASMLDEVIEYLKQLQAQVELMSMRNMSQMIMPLGGIQQQLQMSMMARMAMGLGLGFSNVARTTPQPVPVPQLAHPFLIHPMVHPQTKLDPRANDPFCAYLAQTMNMDIYNKMVTMYGRPVNPNAPKGGSPSPTNNVRRN